MDIYHLFLACAFLLSIDQISAYDLESTSTSILFSEKIYEMADCDRRYAFFSAFLFRINEISILYNQLEKILRTDKKRVSKLSTVFSIDHLEAIANGKNVLEMPNYERILLYHDSFLDVVSGIKKHSGKISPFDSKDIRYWEAYAQVLDIIVDYFGLLCLFLVPDRNTIEVTINKKLSNELKREAYVLGFSTEEGKLSFFGIEDQAKKDWWCDEMAKMTLKVNQWIEPAKNILSNNLKRMRTETEKYARLNLQVPPISFKQLFAYQKKLLSSKSVSSMGVITIIMYDLDLHTNVTECFNLESVTLKAESAVSAAEFLLSLKNQHVKAKKKQVSQTNEKAMANPVNRNLQSE